MLILAYHATLAQLVEQLIRNQQVGSSNLLGGSKKSRSIERDFSFSCTLATLKYQKLGSEMAMQALPLHSPYAFVLAANSSGVRARISQSPLLIIL